MIDINKPLEPIIKKNIKLKQVHIKDNMFVFIRSIIENPSFDSQIKEYLTTPPSKFGSKFEVSEKNIEKLIVFKILFIGCINDKPKIRTYV